MKHFYLVRHALTDHNKERRFTGVTDVSISDECFEMVKGVKDAFKDIKVDKVYTSELMRTKQTIAPLLEDKKLKYTPRRGFNEMNFGDFETRTFDEISGIAPDFFNMMGKSAGGFKFPNGESVDDAFKRNTAEFQKAVDDAEDGETVVISTHAGCIRNIITYALTGDTSCYWKFMIDNISVTHIIYDDGFFYFGEVNKYVGRDV